MTNRKVLLVEDEKSLLNNYAAKIRKEGYEVSTAGDGAEAWKVFQGTRFLVVVTDLMMPNKGGLEILQEIKKTSPATRVIIMTGFGKEYAIQALNSQAFFWVQKGGRDTAQKLMQAIEKAFAEAEVQLRVEREMLSFLTHTLFSAISGGPETVDQVLEYAQSALGERYHETDVYRMINNIASLKAVFMSVASLLEAYQIFVNEPDTFKEKWQEDQPGDVSLAELFSVVLRQTLGSMLFEEANLEQLGRILTAHSAASISTTRQIFLKEVFWSEEVSRDLSRVLSWIQQNLPIISVEIKSPGSYFDPGGVRYAFLFAILAEIIYNALKYTDCREAIRIEWGKQGDKYLFSCRNTFSQASTRRRGSQKGLSFVSGLTQMIEGIRLLCKSESDVFTVELLLEANILDGGAI